MHWIDEGNVGYIDALFDIVDCGFAHWRLRHDFLGLKIVRMRNRIHVNYQI